MSTAELYDMATDLRQIHAVIKTFYGDKFEGWVTDIEPQLRERAKASGTTIFSVAIRWSKESNDEKFIALVLAVAVELKLREVVSVMEGAKS